MQRYFIKEKIGEEFILYDSDIHHIRNVMRMQIGNQIEVVYDNIVYLCNIRNLSPLSLEIIKEYTEKRSLDINLTIAIALVNEQKMDLILQKLTELGATRIIPLITSRSIVKIDDKREKKKMERWQMICKEASEQSKRTSIPVVENIKTLKELTEEKEEYKLLCSLGDDSKPISRYLTKNIKSILFTIGPEGGFTDKEEQELMSKGFMRVTLGKRVMRVETAAIYVASVINYLYEG